MKKYFGIIVSLAIVITLAFSFGCTEEDTNGPVITILGNDPLIVVLNDQTWVDPGATAEDAKDGAVDVTATNDVNENFQASTYSITYTAIDESDNMSTATRVVHVQNSAHAYEGNYDGTIKDNGGNVIYTYTTPEIVTTDNTVNNRIKFAKFGGYNPNEIYGNVTGTAITVPSQTNTVNSASTTFEGTGNINGTTMVIDFTETVSSLSEDYTVTYIKQ